MAEGNAAPVLSLQARSLWVGPGRPAAPAEALASFPREVRALRDLGAGAVEVGADVYVLEDGYAEPSFWARVAGALRAEGLQATVHLPFVWPDLTALDREVWEGSVRSLERALRALEPLDPLLAAVHPANYATWHLLLQAPEPTRPALAAAFGERLVQALRRLRQGPAGGIVALENLEGMSYDLFQAVVEAADIPVCLDVGHAVAEGLDPVRLLHSLGPRVAGLHLHDAVPRTRLPRAMRRRPPTGPWPRAPWTSTPSSGRSPDGPSEARSSWRF